MSLPKKTNERIQYVEQHIAPFETSTVAIGLVAGDVTDLETKAAAARTAFDLRESLRLQTEAATVDLNSKVDTLTVAWAACTDKIKGKAKQVGGTSVYTLAQIPPPATPSPTPAPGEPTNFAVELENNGALTLTWKCANPAGTKGTMYQLYRKVEGETAYTYIGGSGQRSFVDTTLPQGVSQVMYQIQAVRSTAVGPWATFVVTIGTVAGGGMGASVVMAKKAA